MKQPTLADLYFDDDFINTTGVVQGLMSGAKDGDQSYTFEKHNDGSDSVFYRTDSGLQYFLGVRNPEDIQLAAGPTDVVSDAGGAAFGIYPSMGKRTQKSDIGEKMITGAPDFAAGGVRGFTASSGGILGDMQKLGRFIGAIATDNEGGSIEDKLTRAGAAMEGKTFFPSTEDWNKEGYTIPGTSITIPPLPVAVPAGTSAFGMTPEERQKASEAGQFVGELTGDPFAAYKAGKLAVKGVSKLAETLAPKAAEMARQGIEKMAAPMQTYAVQPSPNTVSTRLPTAVKSTEDPLTSNLIIDFDSVKSDPKAFEHNMSLVQQYPNFASKARNPEKRAEDFIEEVKNNLLYLYDNVPEQTRERSKLWYDGARNITTKWSDKYQIPDQAVSGVLAVLSPQKDWFMNVSLGERVLDIMTTQQATKWDNAMSNMAKVIWSKPQYAPMVDAIKGKSLGEISDPGLKAMWLRTYDQAFNPREHQIVTPEGDFSGIRLNADGSPTKTGWGSLNEIGKAIVIFNDPSRANISNNLGEMHKVRNFYNNIYAPNDPSGAVTIDTHAVAAGLLRPLSGNSREVKHNFGSNVTGEVGPANSSITGVQGTYGLYAEAYRRAAQERGILPREMQSITWEAVRGLFPDTFKSQAKNVEQIDNIWLKYRKGQLSLDEARNDVFNAAGGINPPEWEGARLRSGTSAEVQSPVDQGELSGPSVSRGTSKGVGGGKRNGTSGSIPKSGDLNKSQSASGSIE